MQLDCNGLGQRKGACLQSSEIRGFLNHLRALSVSVIIQGITMPSVRGYSYQPDPRRWMAAGGIEETIPRSANKYIGVELEVEGKPAVYSEDVAAVAPYHEQLGYYLKSDSSLRNGFEIVTHPRTLDRWIEDKSTWHILFKWLVEQGMVSYDTGRCGLHVHLSKNHFQSTAHAVRFAAFFHQNPAFSYTLSRRKPNSISAYSQLVSTNAHVFEKLSFASWPRLAQADVFSHHSCMSFSRYDTLEVRLFRGTLNTESFFGYLALVSALAEYTKETLINKQTLDGFYKHCCAQFPAAARLVEVAEKKSKSQKVEREMVGLVPSSRTILSSSAEIGNAAVTRFRSRAGRSGGGVASTSEAIRAAGSAWSYLINTYCLDSNEHIHIGKGHSIRSSYGSDYYCYLFHRSRYEFTVEERDTVNSHAHCLYECDWNSIKRSGVLELLARDGFVLRAHVSFMGNPREEDWLKIDYQTGELIRSRSDLLPHAGQYVYLVVHDEQAQLPATNELYLG